MGQVLKHMLAEIIPTGLEEFGDEWNDCVQEPTPYNEAFFYVSKTDKSDESPKSDV